MRQLLVLFAMSFWAGQCLNAQADASYLRGKRIINPLSPSDTQGIGWDNAGKQFKPLSYLLQSGASNYCAPSGASTTTYTCSLSPTPTAYSAGMSLTFRPDVTNSGASTVNVIPLGAKNIQKVSSGALAAVASGDLVANAMYTLNYNGTVFVVQLGSGGSGFPDPGSNGIAVRTALNTLTVRTLTGGSGISVTNGDGVSGNPTVAADTTVVLSRATDQAGTDTYCRSTTGNDTYTCTLTPTLTAYTRGGCLTLDADTANTGTATVNVDTLGAKSILSRSGGALSDSDIPANKPMRMCYDGTQFIIQGATSGSAATVPGNYQKTSGSITLDGTDKTIFTYTVPAGSMATGSCLRFDMRSAHTTGTGNVTHKVWFGSTSVDLIASNSDTSVWRSTWFVCADSQSAQTMLVDPFIYNNGTILNYAPSYPNTASPAEALSGTVVVKYTANGAGTEAITGYLWKVTYQP